LGVPSEDDKSHIGQIVVQQFSLPKTEMMFLKKGAYVHRFKAGGYIDKGKIYLSADSNNLIFSKSKWVSFDHENIIHLSTIIKVVDGFDDSRTPFHLAMSKYKAKIAENTCCAI